MKSSQLNISILKHGLLYGTLIHVPLFILLYSFLTEGTLYRKVASFWLGLVMVAAVKYIQSSFRTFSDEEKPMILNTSLFTIGLLFLLLNDMIARFSFIFYVTFIFSIIGSTYYLTKITIKKYNRHYLIMITVFFSLIGANIVCLIFENYAPVYTSSILIANITITVTAFMLAYRIGTMWEQVAMKKETFNLELTLNGIYSQYTNSVLILILMYYGLAIVLMPLFRKSSF